VERVVTPARFHSYLWAAELRSLCASRVLTDAQGNSTVLMSISREGPSIYLTNTQALSMQLGSTYTEIPGTGKTQRTSAASIVMLGNDRAGHVIWRAP